MTKRIAAMGLATLALLVAGAGAASADPATPPMTHNLAPTHSRSTDMTHN